MTSTTHTQSACRRALIAERLPVDPRDDPTGRACLHGQSRFRKRLSDDVVRAIRREYVPWKVGTYRLADKYGTSQDVVWNIVTGRTYRNVTEEKSAA